MNTKKTSFGTLSLLFMLTVALFSGCANNTIPATEDNETVSNTGDGSNVTFEFLTAGEYTSNANTKGVTRAANANNEGRFISSNAEELGNGLEALVEVIETPQTQATTRAVTKAPKGKYTVLAYKDGKTLTATWKLNFDGNKYTAEQGTQIENFLPKGKYILYVFNEYLSFENNKIVAKLGSNNNQALYATQEINVVKTKGTSKLTLTVKPYFAQVYFQIKAFTSPNFTDKLSGEFSYKANTIPSTYTIDPITNTTDSTLNAQEGTIGKTEFDGIKQASDNAYMYYVQSKSPLYLLPGTNLKKLSFRFDNNINGAIYQKSAKGKAIAISQIAPENIKANHTYTISVTIYYEATYLFSDGTTGTMAKRGIRTPIAYVVGKNGNNTYAIALKDAKNETAWSPNGDTHNSKWEGNYNKALELFNGYEMTYETVIYKRQPVEKAKSDIFPAYKAVAEYNPGVELTGSIKNAKWFLPSLGEWNLATKALGTNDLKNYYNRYVGYSNSLKQQLIKIIFQQAGGETINQYYWSSTDKGGNQIHTIVLRDDANGPKISQAMKTSKDGATRAFIRF